MRLGFLTGCVVVALTATACGGDEGGATTSATTPASAKSAALTLQDAMTTASRAIDEVRGTRASLEGLSADLQAPTSQTSDVVVLLTPKATEDGVARTLLTAARQQRSFLQFAADAAKSRSQRAASSALTRTRASGRRASDTLSLIHISEPTRPY